MVATGHGCGQSEPGACEDDVLPLARGTRLRAGLAREQGLDSIEAGTSYADVNKRNYIKHGVRIEEQRTVFTCCTER